MADGSAVRSELRSEAHGKGYGGGKKQTVFLKKKTRTRFIGYFWSQVVRSVKGP